MELIRILGKDKKPALTFSSDADSVYAHYTDKNTTKIDIDLEDYTPIGLKGDFLYMAETSGIGSHGLSVLNLKNKKIQSIIPDDCHSVLNAMNSLNNPIPYAAGMECDGKKEIIYFDQEWRRRGLIITLSIFY